MKNRGTPIEIIRTYNAGENLIIGKKCKEKLRFKVEFPPPDTPKLNGVVERDFAITWDKSKILMKNAGLKDNVKRNKLILIKVIATTSFLTEVCH